MERKRWKLKSGKLKPWRLKLPPQPLVFFYRDLSSLCCALSGVYALSNRLRASLSLYRGEYILALWSPLRLRERIVAAAGRWGTCLGPAPVFYSYCAEHGVELSQNALKDLNTLL